MLIIAIHAGVVYLARGIAMCPLPHSRLYLGVLFWLKNIVPLLFQLTSIVSADVLSSIEASNSEPLDGCCGMGNFDFGGLSCRC